MCLWKGGEEEDGGGATGVGGGESQGVLRAGCV